MEFQRKIMVEIDIQVLRAAFRNDLSVFKVVNQSTLNSSILKPGTDFHHILRPCVVFKFKSPQPRSTRNNSEVPDREQISKSWFP